jgi:serine protease Do
MAWKLTRARVGAAVIAAFFGGMLVASSLDFTHQGFAQSAGTHIGISKPSAQQIKPLAEQNNAFVSIAEHVTPAVVSIQTARDPREGDGSPRTRGRQIPGLQEFFNQFPPSHPEPDEASGSGFIVTPDGYILTNNHVVADADRVTVTLNDHRVFKAKVIGRDPTTDVAVIKIDATDLPTVSLGDDSQTRVGEWVLAFGNPLGLDFTVTAGIVSAKGRGTRELIGLMRNPYAISDFIQTDAAINPGNSGGPLVNIAGEVVGINSAIASPTGYYSGYGFAIPITLAKGVMDDIIKYGKVHRAVLGIAIGEVDPDDAGAAGLKTIEGVKISGFSPSDGSSPAEKAGLEAGDIIVGADAKPVDRVSTLQRIVRMHQPGQTIALDVMRFGTRKTFSLKLSEAPSEEQVAERDSDPDEAPEGVSIEKLGLSGEPVTSEIAVRARIPDEDRGLIVTEVSGSGPAHGKLQENDVIVAVLYPEPRTDVHKIADLENALARSKNGDFVTLLVYSFGNGPGSGHQSVVSLRIGGDGRE